MHHRTNIPSSTLLDPPDLDERLDEALKLTFPASDPIALGHNADPPSHKSRKNADRVSAEPSKKEPSHGDI